jgi:hypothetical protein
MRPAGESRSGGAEVSIDGTLVSILASEHGLEFRRRRHESGELDLLIRLVQQNRLPGLIHDDSAIVAFAEVLFDLSAELVASLPIQVLAELLEQVLAIHFMAPVSGRCPLPYGERCWAVGVLRLC